MDAVHSLEQVDAKHLTEHVENAYSLECVETVWGRVLQRAQDAALPHDGVGHQHALTGEAEKPVAELGADGGTQRGLLSGAGAILDATQLFQNVDGLTRACKVRRERHMSCHSVLPMTK